MARSVPVAVVGGGPAGLLAAEVLASEGDDLDVTVHERMRSPGRKLQLAGRGGLNLTHTEPLEVFLERYGPAQRALEPAIRAFPPGALRAWTGGLGQRAVVGTSGRVFPEAFRATPLLRAWLARLDGLGVTIRTRRTWQGWTDDGGLRFAGPDGSTDVVHADATVLALGGASWPGTGSDGGWVGALTATGVDVAPLRAANSGLDVDLTDHLRQRFAGTPLKNIGLRCGRTSVRGEAILTRTGLEGGAVYAIGRAVRDELDRRGRRGARLHLDLRPDLDEDELAHRLATRRRSRDSASTGLRRAVGLPPVAVALLRDCAPDAALPTAPAALARRIKDVELRVTGTEPLARAISTAGGIALGEVDERFMLRRRPGTFVAGEMLDWDAPTGGYLLQATCSTAVAAARGVLAWLTP
ncbi:MAG TPA: TIGR03862 family flavoprotein [Acidimicrobiales bacterium]|nr:TIGR03862 family flavoprotein [Acidimicrobiales bacterium]